MRRPCLGYPGFRCRGLAVGGARCTDCQRALWRLKNHARDPFARRLYGSAEWRRLAGAVIAAATGCYWCGARGVPLSGDHVDGVRFHPSRALDPSNVVAACGSCQRRRQHDPTWRGARA